MRSSIAIVLLGAASVLAAESNKPTSTVASVITKAPAVKAVQPVRPSQSFTMTDYTYAAPADVPYKVEPYQVGRGPQSGYNICNSTTAGPTSQCQTLYINSIKDWCLWGSPETSANGTIGADEAAVVAYCTTNAWGTRVIGGGAITAVQFMKTSAYIQIVGRINQTALNLLESDFGGELDPHGADLEGNPIGGLVFSNALLGGANSTFINSNSWNNFVGGGTFCFKICNPEQTNPNYCENRYDLIGCNYNMPAAYAPNVFESCEGDLQDVVGTYTSGGQTLTWSQPSVVSTSLPWTPRIPASSNCKTYQSTDIFAAAPTTSTSATGAAATGGVVAATNNAGNAASTGSGAASAAGARSTGSTSGAGSLLVGRGGVVAGFLAISLAMVVV